MIENFISVDIEINATSKGDLSASCKIQIQRLFLEEGDVAKVKAVLSHFKSLFANGVVSINSSDEQNGLQPRTRPLLPSDKSTS